jgi:hypothetical protein
MPKQQHDATYVRLLLRQAGMQPDEIESFIRETDKKLNLIGLVRDMRDKLMLYRKERGGEYTGGVEYSELMRRANIALGIQAKS